MCTGPSFYPYGWNKTRQIQAWVGGHHYRTDPIPWVSRGNKASRSYGKYYRGPKTTHERRWSCDPEIRSLVRAKRNKMNLPDRWDDIPRGNFRPHPSWKVATKRRKQWK